MRVTVRNLAAWKAQEQRFTVLTAYDALTARLLDEAGIPVLLVGDSVGMVVLGYDSTLPVTMEVMEMFTGAVARGARDALVVADLPFGSYQASDADAVRSATRLLRAGAQAVKLEGGTSRRETVRRLVEAGIPVMGHVGLTPQSVHAHGGYRVQGRGEDAAAGLLADADALAGAGCFAVVLEAVPATLARTITARLPVPTIGIGAGPDTDGQVLVTPDLLGLTGDPAPRFVRRYADLRGTIDKAARVFRDDVTAGRYPAPEHTYE